MWTFRSRNCARNPEMKTFQAKKKTNKIFTLIIDDDQKKVVVFSVIFTSQFYLRTAKEEKLPGHFLFFGGRILIGGRLFSMGYASPRVSDIYAYICFMFRHICGDMRSDIYRKFPMFCIYEKKQFKLKQNKFPTSFVGFFVPTYSVYLSWGVAKEVFFQTARYTYSVFVGKCNKINNIFPNGVCVAPFEKKIIFLLHLAANMLCKLEQKKLQSKSEISDLFCDRFLFQLRVYFVVYNKSKISNIFWTNFVIN